MYGLVESKPKFMAHKAQNKFDGAGNSASYRDRLCAKPRGQFAWVASTMKSSVVLPAVRTLKTGIETEASHEFVPSDNTGIFYVQNCLPFKP